MRLEHCIRRWLGLVAHRVRRVEEQDECLIAEIEAIEGRLPRCGCCGQKVRRTKGRAQRRLWRDLKIRHVPLVLAYTPRRVVCQNCGVAGRADALYRAPRGLAKVNSQIANSMGSIA